MTEPRSPGRQLLIEELAARKIAPSELGKELHDYLLGDGPILLGEALSLAGLFDTTAEFWLNLDRSAPLPGERRTPPSLYPPYAAVGPYFTATADTRLEADEFLNMYGSRGDVYVRWDVADELRREAIARTIAFYCGDGVIDPTEEEPTG